MRVRSSLRDFSAHQFFWVALMSLFDQSFGSGSYRVNVLKVNPGRPVEFVVRSEYLPRMNIHFLGRAYVCPGVEAGCPACGLYASRHLGYLVSGTSTCMDLVEVGAPTLDLLGRLLSASGLTSPLACRLELKRSAAKRPIFPTLLSSNHDLGAGPIERHEVLRAMARLFTLPSPHVGESNYSYEDRTASTLVEVLRRRLYELPAHRQTSI